MANTYSQIYLHIVFAVKGRENLIGKNWKEELYKYICGIVNNNSEKVYAINGVGDHVHVLLSIKPDTKLSDLMREIKASSSKWINQNKFVAGKFQWQAGFGAFSSSQSQLDNVIAYIDNQEKHHSKQTFKQEYLGLLQKFNIEFDDRYVFEWIG